MTNQEKIQIWEALYKCTRNGYPGATYQEYDTPKDPRVRGGRWNWTYHQLRDLYEQLVKWGEANEPTAAWRELEKYKNKIPPACLRSIYQSIVFAPPPPPGLKLVFDDISSAPVANPTDVNDWNTLFNLPTSGTPFTSVVVVGTTTLILVGATNIGTTDASFFSTLINEIDDQVGCIKGAVINCKNCSELQSVNYPAAIYAFKESFRDSGLITAILPLLQDVGPVCFSGLSRLETLYIPSCTNLGGTPSNDNVFLSTVGDSNLVVTIDSSRATCNSGNPDGDLQDLVGNIPTATITYV